MVHSIIENHINSGPVNLPFFFSLDRKETKDQALPARRPFMALFAKTAELASLEQPPFWTLTSAKGCPAPQAMAILLNDI